MLLHMSWTGRDNFGRPQLNILGGDSHGAPRRARVGTVKTVEFVAGSDKLLKLTVEFGDRRRSVLAGLRNERLDPKAELKGRQAVFVVNLAPRKMAGQISEAMLL